MMKPTLEHTPKTLQIPPQGDILTLTLAIPAGPGVCLFLTDQNQPVTLLTGANLRSLVRRRLTQPTEDDHPTRRTKLRPIVRNIHAYPCYSWFESQLLYFQLARSTFPDNWNKLLPSHPLSLIHIDPNAQYPCFRLSSRLRSDKALYWGPFPNPKSANQYLQVLQDLFDLCRCPDRLGSPEKTASCPYAQMDRCIKICLPATQQKHQLILKQAIQFLDNPQPHIQQLNQRMKKHADDRQYEQAHQIKQKIKAAKSILSPTSQWTQPIHQFLLLALLPGPPIPRTKKNTPRKSINLLQIRPGSQQKIAQLPASNPHDLSEQIQQILHNQQNQQFPPPDPDLFAWIAWLLYHRQSHKNTLFCKINHQTDFSHLASRIQDTFFRKPTV